MHLDYLTLIWVGFLGIRFEVGGGKITCLPPPRCLKLVRIMLATSNLAGKYTPINNQFRKIYLQCLGSLNFDDVTIVLQYISVFCPKKYLYSKQ